MASDLVKKKAQAQAERVTQKYGEDAYGGTKWRDSKSVSTQKGSTTQKNKSTASSLVQKKAQAQAESITQKYGEDAYGGVKWRNNLLRKNERESNITSPLVNNIELPTNRELAAQARKKYEDYLASDEYAENLRKANRDKVNQQLQHALAYPFAGIGDTPVNARQLSAPQDEKERELKAKVDYYDSLAKEEENREIMERDLAELETWSDEDRAALETYIIESEQEKYALMLDPSFSSARFNASALFQKYGAKKVKEMAESYSWYQNAQNAEQVDSMSREAVQGNAGGAVLHSVGSVGANILGAMAAPLGYLGEVTGRTGRYTTMDPNNVGTLFNTYSGAVRQQVASDIEGDGDFAGKVGATLYQAGMSAVDNLARAALGGGNKVISLGLAAAGSFGQTMSEASQQGATPVQALVLSTAKAGLEVATEYLPLDNLLKQAKGGTQTLKQLIWNIFKQGAVEATEEEVNFIGSLLAEAAILQEKSSYNQQIGELMAQGMTYAEARENANWAVVNEAISTALTSWLSGSMSSGVTGAVANIANRGQQVQSQMEEFTESFGDQVMRQLTQGQTTDSDQNTSVQFQTAEQVSQETVEQAERLSQAIGREIVFYTSPMTETGIENGYYQDGKIYINTQSSNPVAQIVSHELTHSVEAADVYSQLSAIVMDRIQAQGGNLQQLRQQKQELYARNGHDLDNDSADREIVAEYVEQYLLSDEQSIMELTRQDRSLSQRILNWIDSILAKLGNRNAQERAFLNNARNLYAQALQQTQSSFTSTQNEAADSDSDSDAQDVLRWAREQYAAGNMTEEEFDGILEYVMQQEELEGGAVQETKHSFAGINAKNADLDALAQAKELDEQGVANETIRQMTGWFKGMDGKWRWEIDDSKMQYTQRGDLSFRERNPGYVRYRELLDKSNRYALELSDEAPTESERSELKRLGEIWHGAFQKPGRITEDALPQDRLADYLQHDELFEAYPQLRKTRLRFSDLPEGTRGKYDPEQDVITLSESLRRAPENTLIHEIQHIIQNTEGFTGGASPEFWDSQQITKPEYESAVQQARNTVEQVEARFRQEWTDDINLNLVKRYIELDNQLWADESDPVNLQELANQMDQIEQAAEEGGWEDLFNDYYYAIGQLQMAKERAKLHRRTSIDLYQNTAGEIEARDVTARRNMTLEQRRMVEPERSNEDTVFAEDSGISLEQDISEYPYNMQTVIQDYMDAVDDNVLSFVDEVQSGQAWKGKKITVGTASSQMVKDIASLTGVENTEGCKILMNTSAVEHIQKRHGENGAHDNTMRNSRDIARMDYVLQNYDSMELSHRKNLEYKNREGSASQMVVISKKINGTYFVIEAVPNTGKIGIVSAYMDKNGASQVPDDNASGRNVRNELASAPTDSLSEGQDTVKRQYSISENEDAGEQVHTAEEIRESLPAKARDYLARAERKLLSDIGEKLSVPRFARRDYLQNTVQEISNEYLQTGTVADEKIDFLFDQAYAEGIIVDREFYDQFKEVKDHIRTTGVTISKQDQSDIADYNDFRRKAFGTVRIVNDGGLPVDVAYMELHGMAPSLFPESITHPADQLVRMYEVGQSIRVSEKSLQDYYGENAEEYRRWAKHDFAASVGDIMGDLRTVKRFADEQTDAADAEKAPTTPEEAAEAWKQLKDARRTYEKAMAKNLLTDRDEMQVGRLLRGEILPEHLDPETDNVKGITAVYEAKQEYERLTKLLGEYRRSVRAKHREKADGYLATANDWKDKRVGIAYSRETMRRNILDIVPDRAVAESVNEEYFEPVHDAEAAAVRFKDDFRDRVRALGLSTKPQKGNLVSEAHAVQLLGEAEDNIRVLQNSKGRLKQRDGKTLAEWHAVVNDLWKESPSLDRTKVQNAVTEFRKIYDELFQQMNDVRIRNGYEPVNYRQGYFPHFQPGDGDGILAHFGKVMGIDTQVAALPTTINGLTHTFKPGIQWFGNAQERLGFNTAYDAVEGFDKYIEGVASVIYQTENIQKLRALATQIRYRTSDEGIRKQVDAVNSDTRLTEEEKQIKINDVYEHGKYTLSNFVNELDEYTNLLANKKSKLDRTMEAMMGRRAYTIMKAWESRVGANMIAGNLSSALTNFIPLTQAGAQLDSGSIIKGMAHTLKSYKEDDGLVGMSSFLTNRRGSDPLIRTWQQKTSQILGTPMELIDNFTADSIVRAAYFQNLKRGMSEAEAMHQADIFASSVMADRSKGAMPTLFESTNPIFKAFTQFQLEVNNQYSEVFKDLPRNHREKGLAALAGVLLKYFLGAFLYNEAYEFFVGRRPALDPFGILNDTVGDLTGYELPNLMEFVTGEDRSFETEKVGIGEAGKNLAGTVLGELPFSSGLTLMGIETDGGRIPASSAVPDLTALWDAATTEGWSPEKRWKEVSDELSKLMYVVPPFGGNQIQKVWKGVSSYIQGGSYNVDAEGNDILQYPVFNDDPEDFWSLVRASILGKSSLKTAQDWVESGFKSLSAKQTAVYQDMTTVGVKDREAFDLLNQLQGAEGAEAQREILRSSEISAEGKAIAYYGLVASDSERELMDQLAEAGAAQGEMVDLMMDLKDAGVLKGTDKKRAQRDALADTPMTDEEKMVVVGSILGTEMTTENGGPTKYANFLAAVDAGLSVDRFMDLHAGGADMEDYLTLTDAGVDPGEAADLALALCELEPEAGAESVSRQQRWQVIVDSDLSEGDQLTALSTAMTESELEKLEAGYTFGVTPKAYVEFKGLLPEYDANGNGSFTQAEVKNAIDALSGGEVDVLLQLMGETSEGMGLTNQQKAVLWQLQNKSWKPGKNPYDREVGQRVYDALHGSEGEAEEQETEDELLKQLLGLG